MNGPTLNDVMRALVTVFGMRPVEGSRYRRRPFNDPELIAAAAAKRARRCERRRHEVARGGWS